MLTYDLTESPATGPPSSARNYVGDVENSRTKSTRRTGT